MSGHVLGIDLGTTNSVVAIADETGMRVLPTAVGDVLIPSVVSFHPSGAVVVGREGRERRLLDAKNTVYSVKRLIGRPFTSAEVRQAADRFPFEIRPGPSGGVLVVARDESYTLAEISAFVLREVRSVAEQALGETCSQAIITVPANFDELQRSATKAAGRVAGLEVLRILNEPTAAALAYGYGRGSNERVAVFDLGGGTFDLTVLHLAGDVIEVIATAGDTYLGGDDIDALVADRMAEAFLAHHRYDARQDRQALERLRAAAEWAKCQLSSQDEVQLRVEELAYGAGGTSLDLTFGLTRGALEEMSRPLIARAFDVCEDAMRVAGMRPSQLDNVILVGGSTRMPLVKHMVTQYFGRQPLTGIDPDLVVAQGAAIQGYALRTARGRASRSSAPPKRAPISADPLFTEPTRPSVRPPLAPPSAAPQVPPPPPPPRRDLANEWTPAASHRAADAPSIAPTPKVADRWHSEPPSGPAFQPERAAPPPVPRPPALPGGPPPLLVDVTPFSLGVETVDGFCEHIIKRNSPVPTEQTKLFAPGRDDQQEVAIRISQGESRRLEQNRLLGEVLLQLDAGLRRTDTEIEVTFVLDADGTLAVRAMDRRTGRAQATRIRLIGGILEEDLGRMQDRLERLAGA